MTGFGRASFQLPGHNITIEVSSVNKRSLEFSFTTPKEWQFFEFTAGSILKNKLERGRVRVLILVEQLENTNAPKNFWQDDQVIQDLDALEKFVRKRKGQFNLTPELLIQIAHFKNKESIHLPLLASLSEDLSEALEQASDAMIEMREREGNEIFLDTNLRLTKISNLILEMKSETENMSADWEKRLLERLRKSNLSIESDDERVLKEIALYAEKCDVTEEITRLQSHIKQFEATCKSKGSIGRKLEFLLQEIGRELNTFCSKSIRSTGTSIALEARVEVEKIREQILNIE